MNFSEIHSDDRGSITLITGLKFFPEATIFVTKSGYARGGCIHDKHEEYVCVIEGAVSYVCDNVGNKRTLIPGEIMIVRRNSPHYFLSITDSVVMEWGATAEEKRVKYPQFREIVDRINEK
jgi:mannose-6-phosphate isomerase-like protein (cupin superfamily)